MLIADVNPTQLVLELLSQDFAGADKINLVAATVTVYHVTGAGTVVDLVPTNLVHVLGTNIWRYRWIPIALPAGQYFAEYSITDTDGANAKAIEDVLIGYATSTLPGLVADAVWEEAMVDHTVVGSFGEGVNLLYAEGTGEYNVVGNQMLFYDTAGVLVAAFNLFDAGGLPAMTNVTRRVPVP